MVSLFDGIGALRVAVDALRVPVAGYISAEISEDARRAETTDDLGLHAAVSGATGEAVKFLVFLLET